MSVPPAQPPPHHKHQVYYYYSPRQGVQQGQGVIRVMTPKVLTDQQKKDIMDTLDVIDVTKEYPKIIKLCEALSQYFYNYPLNPLNQKVIVPIVLEFLLPLLKDGIHQKFLLGLLHTSFTYITPKEKGHIQSELIKKKPGLTFPISVGISTEWNRTDKAKVMTALTRFNLAMQYLFVQFVKKNTLQSLLEITTPLDYAYREYWWFSQSSSTTDPLYKQQKENILRKLRRFLSLWKRDMAPVFIASPSGTTSITSFLKSPFQKLYYKINPLQEQVKAVNKTQSKHVKEGNMLLKDIGQLLKNLEQTFSQSQKYKQYDRKYKELLQLNEEDKQKLSKIKKLLQDVSSMRLLL